MADFFGRLMYGFSISDVIDMIIVAFVIYKVLEFIRETRAEQLVKGLLILVIATFLSGVFRLHTLNWILSGTLTLGVVALIIVFQPELRRGLEYIGRKRFLRPRFSEIDKDRAKQTASVIVKAVDKFSSTKTGALIILERQTPLSEIAETGTKLDSEITVEILEAIFYDGAPMHDGAVLIKGDRINAAGCVLPLSVSKQLESELGTRHRAGIGITEHSDAVAIIVSEETGIISIAENGYLSRFLDLKTVEKTILNIYLNQDGMQKGNFFSERFNKMRSDNKADGQE